MAVAYNSTDSHLLTWQDNQLTNWNSYAGLFRPWQETGYIFLCDS